MELPDDGPYVTETCSLCKYEYIFVVSKVFWLIILYMIQYVTDYRIFEQSVYSFDWQDVIKLQRM
jgi:hypothetical protein